MRSLLKPSYTWKDRWKAHASLYDVKERPLLEFYTSSYGVKEKIHLWVNEFLESLKEGIEARSNPIILNYYC